METQHRIFYFDAREMSKIEPESVDLIVTSPPYPMISMWDEIFTLMDTEIGSHLKRENGQAAYELMHKQLNKVWRESSKLLKPGGLVCINIGDATRTIKKEFKLYPNHAEVIQSFTKLGYDVLPSILWRKPTNSPTKFMGSGMLPCGAYVTLEHERILLFRKPSRRVFTTNAEKQIRRESSFFWEERNKWFSDFWDLTGAKQAINGKNIRKRSGAFPIEIPLRLIRMFSSKGDTVLDPFLGTATTTLASIICARNSIGFEVDDSFREFHKEEIPSCSFKEAANYHIHNRIQEHIMAIEKLIDKGKNPKYVNKKYGFKVVTRQEVDILFEAIESVLWKKNHFQAKHQTIKKEEALNPNRIAEKKEAKYVSRSIYEP
jgi:DNA modification methylase